MSTVNLWSVVLATILVFVLGGLWYSLLFGRAWIRESGHDESKANPPGLVYGMAVVVNLIAASAFGWLLGPVPELGQAVIQGVVIGGCFVALSLGINYLAASRSVTLLMIDGGFHIVRFVLFGLVFGFMA